MKKLFFIISFSFIFISADWWVTEHKVSKARLKARVYNDDIVCSLSLPENFEGRLYMFYRVDKPLRQVSDLTDASLFLITNARGGYYKLKPEKNGIYHTAAVIMQGEAGLRQSYLFVQSSNSVTVKHLAPVSNTNNKIVKKPPEGYKVLNKKKSDSRVKMTNQVSEADQRMLENFINEIRAFRLEIREKYFDKDYYDNLDIYSFLVRYSAITGKLDNIYMTFITRQYNWEYIPKINHEYQQLTRAVMETYKKITASLKQELEYE